MAQVAQPPGAARCAQHVVARLPVAHRWTRGGEVLSGAPVERGGGAGQGGGGRETKLADLHNFYRFAHL
jgi:hypothetical protein